MKTKHTIGLLIVAALLITGCAGFDRAVLEPAPSITATNSAGQVVDVPQVQPSGKVTAAVESVKTAGTLFGYPVSTVVDVAGGLTIVLLGLYARARNAVAKANQSALATVVAGVEQGGDAKTKAAINTIGTANGSQPLIESVVNPSA